MAFVTAQDGVRLFVEERGAGDAIIFAHEFAGDAASWAPQVEAFAPRYRCITYAARGYPPSDIPEPVDAYSHEHARDDLKAVLDGLGVARAHVVGLSMGSMASLHFALAYQDRAVSLTLAGCGYGAQPGAIDVAAYRRSIEADAALTREQGMQALADDWGARPPRAAFARKRPESFRAYQAAFAARSAVGCGNTLLGYQARRPSLYALTDQLARLTVPTLILVGDEDEPAFDASLMLKRTIPTASLAVLPRSGHVLNAEEPDLFNRLLGDFLATTSARS